MLVAEAMSVTLEVSHTGEMQWWGTRESGALPTCPSGTGCKSCCVDDSGAELRRAYAVLKVDFSLGGSEPGLSGSALFAPLTARSLLTLARMSYWVRDQVLSGGSVSDVASFAVAALPYGLGGGGALCTCRCPVHSLCAVCTALYSGGLLARFVHRDFFDGVEQGDGALFAGVSDAVGLVAVHNGLARLTWMTCPYVRRAALSRSELM